VVVTLFAWQVALKGVADRTRIEFDRQADHTISLFKHQLERYADVLRSSAGFIIGSDEVRLDEWRKYTQQIALGEQYPAIGGLAVTHRVKWSAVGKFLERQRLTRPDFTLRPAMNPDSMEARQFVMPVTLIAPERLEQRMSGFDFAFEARRLDAVERTIKTGTVQISAPIRPVGNDAYGFVLVAPIFNTLRPASESLRQSSFIGAVAAAVVTKNLVNGVLDSDLRQVAISMSDSTEVVYSELDAENFTLDKEPVLSASYVVPLYGREWRFEVHSTAAFSLAQADMTPTLVLVGGLVFNAMLMLFLFHTSLTNQHLDNFGKDISHKYKLQSKALEERNDQLESFSNMASHDLKGPLRAIGFLSECMEEDLDKYQPDIALPPEFLGYLERIKGQVVLGQGLIKGILQYSEIDACSGEHTTNEVNVLELLHSLRMMLTVDEAQLQLSGEFPTFDTYETQLTQVFMNLISNGFKYHHGQGIAVVTVGVEDSPLANYYRFSVADNGPGISPAYHEKIFEPFSTLQPKDHSMSSGVGLAIVRKLVVLHGGRIEVTSDADQGACFSFDWPSSVVGKDDTGDPMNLPEAA